MYKYVFGPVPSRRLGISLGVDLVLSKTCNLDCIYCECGETTKFYNRMGSYVDVDKVVEEVGEVLKTITPNYITFSGSGEPTLNKDMGLIIDKIKNIYKGKIAIITNSTLLYKDEVRETLEKADLIIPSLDAVSKEVFDEINRPAKGVKIEEVLEGLEKFLGETKRKVSLELFIIEGINDSRNELKGFVEFLKDKNYTTIQLNTLARPGTRRDIQPATIKRLEEIRNYFLENGIDGVEIIKKYSSREELEKYSEKLEKLILTMLKKRIYSLQEISELLQKDKEELFKYFDILQKEGKTRIFIENDNIYLKS